jgi:uncharacterized surface protein with fasciclin (FAS1) repeats
MMAQPRRPYSRNFLLSSAFGIVSTCLTGLNIAGPIRSLSVAGNKVYTVFAPTDRAFSVVDTEDLNKMLTDRDMSRALVLRHSIPGTLYSSGMRFYQLRDSLEKGSTIALHKSNGKTNSWKETTRKTKM